MVQLTQLSKMFGRFRAKTEYELLMEQFEKQYTAVDAERRNFLNLAMIERMMPTLRAFAAATERDISLWEGAVETLWGVAKGDLNRTGISELTKECLDAIPEDGETDSDLETFAQNAVISIYDALAHLDDSDPSYSVLISSNLYDCVDGYALFDLGDSPDSEGGVTQQDEADIAKHPIVMQEVQRQFDDLKRLQSIRKFDDNVVREFFSEWHTAERQMFVLEAEQ